jgi:exosortase H (IPTLxxWG-CTERM-specific)
MLLSLEQTRPRLRFALVLVIFVGVVLVAYSEEVLGPPLAPLTTLTAQMTFAFLQWTGLAAERTATLIHQPGGFGYEIYYRCTGFLPVAFLTVSILAYPARPRAKLVGLAVGVPLLIGLNLIRLVHLFYIGVYRPAIFDFAHTVAWEGSIILAIIAIWLIWTTWADSGESRRRSASGTRPSAAIPLVLPVSEPRNGPALKPSRDRRPSPVHSLTGA